MKKDYKAENKYLRKKVNGLARQLLTIQEDNDYMKNKLNQWKNERMVYGSFFDSVLHQATEVNKIINK